MKTRIGADIFNTRQNKWKLAQKLFFMVWYIPKLSKILRVMAFTFLLNSILGRII
jgi:hypothetical protein